MGTLNERIKQLKDERGVTYRDISRKIDVSPATVYQLGETDRDARGYTLIAFAKYFGVSTDWLLGLTDRRQTDDDLIKEIGNMMALAHMAKNQERVEAYAAVLDLLWRE